MVIHLQFATRMYSLTLSVLWLAYKKLLSLRFKLSSRLNQRIFWISSHQILDLHLVLIQIKFFWTEFSPIIACWAHRSRRSRRSRPSEWSFLRNWREWLQNIVRSTFQRHRLCNTDHKTSSSLSLCLRAKSPWETCETEDLNIVVTPNNSVFSRVCFEKSEISSRSGSSISSQKWSCRTRWAQNLCVHPTWPGSQNFSMQVRSGACPALSGRESSARIGTGTWCRGECAGAAKTGETWEGRRRDRDQRHTCNKHHFREHEPCVYVHAHENVRMCADKLCNRKMCVQQVSVCTPSVVHTVVATACVRNPRKLC